ncbi:MAG: hypothetical protein ACODAE_08375 [Gemmatimonadota bacterium]
MSARAFEIHIKPGGRGTIEIDGEPFTGVRRLEIVSTAGDAGSPVVRLDVLASRVDIQGEGSVIADLITDAELRRKAEGEAGDDG